MEWFRKLTAAVQIFQAPRLASVPQRISSMTENLCAVFRCLSTSSSPDSRYRMNIWRNSTLILAEGNTLGRAHALLKPLTRFEKISLVTITRQGGRIL